MLRKEKADPGSPAAGSGTSAVRQKRAEEDPDAEESGKKSYQEVHGRVPGGPVRDSKGLAVQSTGRPTERPKKSYEEVHGKMPGGPVIDEDGLAVQSTGEPLESEKPKKSYEEVHGKMPGGPVIDEDGLAVQSTGEPLASEKPKKSYEEVHGKVPGGPVRDSKGLAVQSTGRPTERPKKSYEEVHGKMPGGPVIDEDGLAVQSTGEPLESESSSSDPWAEVSDEAALTRIKEEEWEITEVTGEPSSAAQLSAKDQELVEFRANASQRRWLVSADLSENQLPNTAAIAGPLWLRHLNLGMNPLESLDGLGSSFPRLLVLDVSFNELGAMDGAWKALAAIPKLQRLVAEGCRIQSFEELQEMPQLRTLEVSDNLLEDLEELDVLAGKCTSLVELDFRENEAWEKPGYAKKIDQLFPNLTWLDNQSRKKYVAKGAEATYSAETMREKEVAAVDGMFKNESCSCIEGNPCLDRATCKDWANREKVAAEARKKKGLRDDTGKIL
ncbi:unnamed protein product [Durusdinium trenchii]|uniref:Uncharacterized protein n=2 Tax=Durusdinium trenchii TaxID=1381693 RepID=A0ABP0NV19_9DINO|eukprot:g3310.t1